MYRAAVLEQKLAFAAAVMLWWCFSTAWAQAPDSGIRMNEVFPRAQTDCPEWLELANISSLPVNLKNWQYGNPDDTCVITNQDFIVQPGRFAVLTKDKTLFSAKYPVVEDVIQPLRWHALDNYHDTMCVWDSAGVLQESAGWDYHWFSGWTTQSLARVSFVKSGLASDAWVMSVRPSPGQPNPEATWRGNGAVLDIGPIPFTPNNDGTDDLLSIKLSMPAAATAALSIYGFDGRKYLDLPHPFTREFLWNGIAAGGRAAPAGPFFVIAEISSNGKRQVIRKKGILWR